MFSGNFYDCGSPPYPATKSRCLDVYRYHCLRRKSVIMNLQFCQSTLSSGLAFLPNIKVTRHVRLLTLLRSRMVGLGSLGHGMASLQSYYDHPHKVIKALSTSDSMALTISTVGLLSLFNASTRSMGHPSTCHSQKTGWACHLQPEASTPFIATGLHSSASIIPIRESGFDSSTPSLGRLARRT